MYPVECVVRGYLSGSGWKEYRESGAVCGIELPAGLLESDKLPEPIFTPATKAEIGDHDENVDFDRAAEIVGDRALMEELRRVSIEVYQRGAEHAAERGIILADTKFEFGRHAGAEIVLADEVLTPDSSRFWPADRYEPGQTQPSFDKQFVRDWADEAGWDHTPPAPELPPDVVEQTRGKYVEAYERITERDLLVAKARVLIRPKEGILDPQGKAVERALPALGFEGIEHVRVGRMVELEAEDPERLAGALREAARQPADRGLRDQSIDACDAWGVLQFPGSCDERDALHACELARRGAAGLARGARPRRRRRGRRPGRLLLRRLPAGGRDRPLLAGDGGCRGVRRRRRARCWASATASRSSARRACCPGRCCSTRSCASSAARSSCRG